MKLRFRFSLRTLLLMMLLIGIGVGFYARWMQQAEKQRAAVEAISAANGFALYDYQLDADGKLTAKGFLYAELPGPDWLRERLGVDAFADVVRVDLYSQWQPGFSLLSDGLDPALPRVAKSLESHLINLPKLETLRLTGYQFTNDWLQHVEGLTSLRELILKDTRITDSAVARLRRELPDCKIIHRPWVDPW